MSPDWVSAIGTILGAIFTAATAFVAWRTVKDSRAQSDVARKSAEHSEKAAEAAGISAEATRKTAEAAEKQVVLGQLAARNAAEAAQATADQARALREQLDHQISMSEPDLTVRIAHGQFYHGQGISEAHKLHDLRIRDMVLSVTLEITNSAGTAKNLRILANDLSRFKAWTAMRYGPERLEAHNLLLDDPYFELKARAGTYEVKLNRITPGSAAPLYVDHRVVIAYQNRHGLERSVGWRFKGRLSAPSGPGVIHGVVASRFNPSECDVELHDLKDYYGWGTDNPPPKQ